MDNQQRDSGWVDAKLFNENNNKVPPEEWFKHAGKYVAWSLDGTRIVASAADEAELERRLSEMGIDPSTVVSEYIPPLDVTTIL